MQTAWWRAKPLNEDENALLEAVMAAHYQSALRSNVSTLVLAHTFDASGDFGKAVAAAIMTMGGKHAPLSDTYRFLSLAEPANEIFKFLKLSIKIPGWGGTFQKQDPDPVWAPVDEILARTQRSIHTKLDTVTIELHQQGKRIHPNPSAYTAATAIALGIPEALISYIFIAGRLTAWAQIVGGEWIREER